LVREILRRLKKVYLTPEGLAELRAEVARQEQEQQGEGAQQSLRAVIADLEHKIARGNTNLLLLPPDRIPGATEALRTWEEELRRRKGDLAQMEQAQPREALETMIQQVEVALKTLEDVMDGSEDGQRLLRDLLREWVARIELSWTHHRTEKRWQCRLRDGQIHLRGEAWTMSVLSPSARR
jgi:hypothetical protein